jgi:hypothetical protein
MTKFSHINVMVPSLEHILPTSATTKEMTLVRVLNCRPMMLKSVSICLSLTPCYMGWLICARAVVGFKALEKYADDTWGTGKRTVDTNPKEVNEFNTMVLAWQNYGLTHGSQFPDQSATVCADDKSEPVQYDSSFEYIFLSIEYFLILYPEDPSCTTKKADLGGVMNGTNGTARVQFQKGFTSTAKNTVTSA